METLLKYKVLQREEAQDPKKIVISTFNFSQKTNFDQIY